MEKKLLSVIIPVYNGESALEHSLRSVLRQDCSDLEVVCVDDGSVDHTAEVLEKFAADDPRIKIIRHEVNRGRMEARRSGARNASGEYLMFLDADDAYDPGLCSRCVHLIRESGADMVQFSGKQVNQETGKTELLLPFTGKLSGAEILKAFFISRAIPTTLWLKIYRTEIVQKAFSQIPPLHSNMGEDVLISFFIAYFSNSFQGIQTRQKYNYNYGSGISSGLAISTEKFAQYCQMSRLPGIAFDFLKNYPENETAREAAERMTVRLLLDCANMYEQVPDPDKPKAAEMFREHWIGTPDLMKCILQAFAEQKQYIDTIYASSSYRVGNAIVLPLRSLLSGMKSR